jgi:hypothetical protein
MNVNEQENEPTPPDAPAPEAVGSEGDGDNRGKALMIKHTDGQMERRTDFIRRRFYDDKVSRSQIRGELKALGYDVSYQIVFSATKEKKRPEGKRAIAQQRAAVPPPPPPPPKPAAQPASGQ